MHQILNASDWIDLLNLHKENCPQQEKPAKTSVEAKTEHKRPYSATTTRTKQLLT